MLTRPVKTEILMNVTAFETRIAVIEDGMLQEIHLERPCHRGLVGNIYKGKVVRVLPGMQAAFVEIGLERAGFLHVVDVMPMRSDNEEVDLSAPEADINQWLKEGQELLVQVVKDPMGTKGARLSTHMSVASRYLVYMPDLQHIGISLKLGNEVERERLQNQVAKVLGIESPKGYIIRTLAEGMSDATLETEIKFLDKLWATVSKRAKKVTAPAVVYEDLTLILRAVRDRVSANVERVRIDSEDAYTQVREFVKRYMPETKGKLEHYQGEIPIFEMYGVESELQGALLRRVPLKSGGHIVIDFTEAMVTIDVNTGGFVGSQNLEETIYKTNLEACQTIARQLRLRNIGGIIIIDFIDMHDEQHRIHVEQTMQRCVAHDYTKIQLSTISDIGLMQVTRKRTHESLMQLLCGACGTCGGNGLVKTRETISYEIFRELMRESLIYKDASGFMIVSHKDIIDYLLDEQSHYLGELEASFGVPVKLRAEASYSLEQYDIVLM